MTLEFRLVKLNETEAISVYEYDRRMLQKPIGKDDDGPNHRLVPEAAVNQTAKMPGRCSLLELPAELRSEIFQYVLPFTLVNSPRAVCWIKGTTALLAVSSQLHDEAAYIMYSASIFVFDITRDVIFFRFEQLRPSGSVSSELYAFPGSIGEHIRFIRKFEINLLFPYNYIGMTKDSISNPNPLINGLRSQADVLHEILRNNPGEMKLDVRWQNYRREESKERLFEPFIGLPNASISRNQ